MASKHNIDIIIAAKDNASKALGRVNDAAKTAAKVGLAALATAAGVAATAAVKGAADFEQSLNVFKAVSGATADQMKLVQQQARALGQDLTLPGVSAGDAALAMVELSKAGLSVNDTLAASKGVLSLAKAGQLDTARAAEIAANALNAFSLEGKEASRVADLLAAAANASSADVTDLAYALQMSSAGAAAVKVPVEDLTTAIAAMANNGIKGSDAGTSLKTMFNNLQPATEKAGKSFRKLNLDFYDAQGNFVGMREMIKQLEEGTRDLTDEQRAQHIENIFGSDSMRAANILIKEGVKGYDELSNAINREGAAVEMAAAMNAGFNGAMDGLKSTLETVATDIGMKLLPRLTNLTRYVASQVEPTFDRLKGLYKEYIPIVREVADKIGGYLTPKLTELWKAIEYTLVPALTRLWKEVIVPMLPVIGGLMVVAVGLLIDSMTVLSDIVSVVVRGITYLWGELAQGNPIIWTLVGAFGGLGAVMMLKAGFAAITAGMHLLTTATIPSVMARVTALRLLIAAPMVMPAIAVGAALGALWAVRNAANEARAAINEAQAANDRMASSDAAALQHAKRQLDSGAWTREQYDRIVRSINGRASGGPVMAGQPYMVGERGPEMFIPSGGGRIANASETARSASHTTNIYGNITLGDATAVDRFFAKLDRQGQLLSKGLAA